MATYEQISRRLRRLEGKEMVTSSSVSPSQAAEDAARWHRLLQQRDWSEPARHLFHIWSVPKGGQHAQAQTRTEETRLLSQLTDEELEALRLLLEQEVARESDA